MKQTINSGNLNRAARLGHNMDDWNVLEAVGQEIIEVFLQHGMFRLGRASTVGAVREHQTRLDDVCRGMSLLLRKRAGLLKAAAQSAVADRVVELMARLKSGSLNNAEWHSLSAVILAMQPIDFWADGIPGRSAHRSKATEGFLYSLYAYFPRFDNGSDLWNAIREATERAM